MSGGNDVQKDLAFAVRDAARHITGDTADDDRLFDLIGDARFVLIGEASHGTHDFYEARAHITRRLIAERGFTAVACEADWPDAYRVNRYIRGRSADTSPAEALSSFKRFPSWIWRNTVVGEFVGWLRAHNDGLPEVARRGFYGLDLYSLYQSIDVVIGYLDGVDAEAAARARERYACFERYDRDSQAYGLAAANRGAEPCEDAAVQQLVELQSRAMDNARRDGILAEDEYFYAEMHARAARDAERYYRAMFHGSVTSWNLRDRHMADTLDALARHLGRHIAPPKVVVWAHDSHLGDARATEMGHQGELSLGQLARERHGDACRNIGFSTYTGTVTAASDWGMPPERKRVWPALAGSYEVVFHDAGTPRFWLDLRSGGDAVERLREPRLQRAIGVVYRPETERMSHYFFVELPAQFDALIHLDETRALEPLERTQEWEAGEAPETFPAGV